MKTKNYNDFFDQLSEIKIETETSIFNQIRNDWGYSSVILKNWLNKYHPLELDRNYTKKDGLNADLFLPYRSNALWSGSVGISRLKLAVETKAYIIFTYDSELNDSMLTFKIECLRLWLRIDSLKTKYSLKEFTDMTNEAAKEAIEDPEKLYDYLNDKQANFKRSKTLYHYSPDDFDIIKPYMCLNEAYETWMKYKFPHLLEYYKDSKMKEFIVYCYEHNISGDYKTARYERLTKELDAIKLKEPNIRSFAKMLKVHNIEYKHRNL